MFAAWITDNRHLMRTDFRFAKVPLDGVNSREQSLCRISSNWNFSLNPDVFLIVNSSKTSVLCQGPINTADVSIP